MQRLLHPIPSATERPPGEPVSFIRHLVAASLLALLFSPGLAQETGTLKKLRDTGEIVLGTETIRSPAKALPLARAR